MVKRNRMGLVILFIVILIAIVIAGQQFSTIGIINADNDCINNPEDCELSDATHSVSCSTTQDCIDYIRQADPSFDVSSVDISCRSGVCEGS